METILQLIIRVSVGSAIFYGFYILLLRKTTFFRLNRIFLLAAVLLPLFFALFPLRYTVLVPGTPEPQTENLADLFGQTQPFTNLQPLPDNAGTNWSLILLAIYCTGLLLLGLRLLLQSIKPIHLILNNKKEKASNYPIVENRHFPVPFSFFNHIFIHPDYHRQEDLDVILAHEEVHIRERHWIDLLVIELFTLVFWFNPISWLLEQAIKQNHEYLADQGVLSRGQSPARYQLLLVNQLMGMQVLGLSNNLNFALGPTRLNMMKKQKTSKKQLTRLALLLPIVAGLLFAFAQPEYKLQQKQQASINADSTSTQITDQNGSLITGIVHNDSGLPIPGASIILQGTTIGTVTDANGKFELRIPEGSNVSLFKGTKDNMKASRLSVKTKNDEVIPIVASYVGYLTNQTNSIKDINANYDIEFTMKRDVIFVSTDFEEGDVPPPPASQVPKTTNEEPVFIVVEDMPKYPGGHYALAKYIHEKKIQFKEKEFFEGSKLSGTAVIGFTVTDSGAVTNCDLLKSSGDEKVDQYAAAIVRGMEDWTPGKQRGKAVPVDYAMRIEF